MKNARHVDDPDQHVDDGIVIYAENKIQILYIVVIFITIIIIQMFMIVVRIVPQK